MAAAYVQEVGRGGSNGATTAVCNVSSAPSAGSVVVCQGSSSADVPTGVTDSKGNTWTIDASGVGGTDGAWVASTGQDVGTLTALDTITVTWALSQTHTKVIMDEYSGLATSARVRSANGAAMASGTARTSASVSATAGDMIVGAFVVKGVETGFTAGSGYTAPASPFNAGTGGSIEREFQVAPSTTSFSPTGTGVLSNAGYGMAVVYKAAGAAGINGDAAITLAGPVASGAGTVAVQGDSNTTLTSVSTAATGVVLVQGSGAGSITLALSSAGSVLVQGSESSSITLALSSAGAVLVQGTGLCHLAVTATGAGTAGTPPISGDAALTLAVVASGAGAVLVQGSAALALVLALQSDGSAPSTQRLIVTAPFYSKTLGIWW